MINQGRRMCIYLLVGSAVAIWGMAEMGLSAGIGVSGQVIAITGAVLFAAAGASAVWGYFRGGAPSEGATNAPGSNKRDWGWNAAILAYGLFLFLVVLPVSASGAVILLFSWAAATGRRQEFLLSQGVVGGTAAVVAIAIWMVGPLALLLQRRRMLRLFRENPGEYASPRLQTSKDGATGAAKDTGEPGPNSGVDGETNGKL